MKALIKSKPEPGLELVDRDIPQIATGQVLLRVRAAGICGSDLHIFDWTPGYDWLTPYLPDVLGHEFSGEVVEVGKDASDLKVGDRVICMPGQACRTCWYCIRGEHNHCLNKKSIGLLTGGFAEFVTVPKENCFKLPEHVDLDVAALAEPMAVAIHAVSLANISIGDSVVVMGPGPIGLLMVFLAKRAGASKVILAGLGKDKERLSIGQSLGADILVKVDEQDLLQTVLDANGGLGVNHAFEASGSSAAVDSCLQVTRKGGKVTLVGIHSRPVEIDPNMLVRQEKGLIGSFGYSPKDWYKVLSILSTSYKELKGIISHRVSLENGMQAFALSKHSDAVKVLITP